MDTKEKIQIFIARSSSSRKCFHYSLDEISVLIEDIFLYYDALNKTKRLRVEAGLYRYDYVNVAPLVLQELIHEKKLKLASSQVLLALGNTPDFSALIAELRRLKAKIVPEKIRDVEVFELTADVPLLNVWILRFLPRKSEN